ncbi:MAG: peptidoglycan synthetase [Bacteroidetes bacterium]|nr:peptidoglycan synthetase [Bacteroidota bacterium]
MRIHFIAIGGAVMHNLALELQQLGHRVSGSDDEIFDPARSRLERAGLLPDSLGWHPERITTNIDQVILGMHARSDNPELARAKDLGLPIFSFPEYLYEHSKNKKRVVVAGSHGKTSTTAMIMHVLRHQGMDFDYLVGSQLEGFERMVRMSNAPLVILEGDEYLTSALDPTPKFLHYHPHLAVITGISWDHINVFPTRELYDEQFRKFIGSMEPDATLVWYEGDPALREIMQGCNLRNLPYQGIAARVEDGRTTASFEERDYPLSIFGAHNMQNLNAAMLVCRELGISEHEFLTAIGSFTGTAKRLECMHQSAVLNVYRDFAHAPSKLKATVQAVRQQFPDRQLIAAYELHTFSSLSKDFLPDYRGCMDDADVRMVLLDPHVFALKRLPVLEDKDVAETFSARVFHDGNNLSSALRDAIQLSGKPVVLLLMSSGKFDDMDIAVLIENDSNS